MNEDRIEQLRRWPAFDLDEIELDELLDAYLQRDALKAALKNLVAACDAFMEPEGGSTAEMRGMAQIAYELPLARQALQGR
jgi:hypothetical protein